MENNNLITSKMLQTMVAIIVSLVLMLSLSPSMAVTVDDTEESSLLSTYIVYVTKPEGGENSMQSVDLDSFYQSFLPVSLSSSDREQRLVYSYRNVVNGFAAKLTAEEAKAIETKEGFVSAHVQKILPLHTTHTPNFLGLHQNLGFWKQSNFGKGVIIGVLDTGITPGHPSFSDAGMPPPRAKWKGKCEFDATACNNKLIGARTFQTDTKPTRGGVAAADPPIDDDGHGTHTSSTAAGNFVEGASVFSQANGTAAGIAPLAHLAMYKVCSLAGCAESDIFAGMDTAIDDGADVLSLSLGIGSAPAIDDGADRNVSCSNESSIPEAQLNYPSFSIIFGSTPQTYTRTVTYVGQGNAIYNVEVVSPEGVDVTVKPEQIMFTETNQKATFSVTFTKTQNTGGGSFSQGYLNWVSGLHTVRSPIVVIFE
ncbi:hypothetical protein QYF36_017791 [Acer negundo]|nr:hypothetical protein QYF36_017791 [Acer negundo]